MTATFSLAPAIYSVKHIEEAARAFAHLGTVRVIGSTTSEIQIEISAKGEASFDVLVAEFLNYLLDASLELHLSSL
jgi:hypothetical protein